MAIDPDLLSLARQSAQEDRDVASPTLDADIARLARKPERQSQWAGVREPTAVERLGRGMWDIGAGLKQMYLHVTNPTAAKAFQRAEDEELAIYEAGTGPGFDPWRMGGQAAATAPTILVGGGGGLLGRAALGAGVGGLTGASMYTKEDESRLGNVMAGSVGGAAVPAAISGVSRLAGPVVSKFARGIGQIRRAPGVRRRVATELADRGVDFTKLSDDVQKKLIFDARTQLAATGNLDASALARRVKAEGLGFQGVSAPTSAQVTRSPRQWAQERNLQRIPEAGEELTERFAAQDEQFVRLRGQVAGPKVEEEVYDTGESVVGALTRKWGESQKRVSAIYTDIRKKYGEQHGVQLSRLSAALDDASQDVPNFPVTESIKNRLTKLGVKEGSEALTVRQAEGLRKAINRLPDGGDPNLMRVKREMVAALDDDVIEGVGDDVFRNARAAAKARFDDFSSNVAKKVVEGNLPPDKTFEAIIKGNVSDLQGLKTNLLETEYGQKAWERIRQQVLSQVWKKAAPQGAESPFSGIAFKKMVNDRIGQRRLGVLFDQSELSMINAIADVGMDLTYTPPRSAVNWSNTAPMIYSLLSKAGRFVPGVGDQVKAAADAAIDRYAVSSALGGAAFDQGLLAGSKQAISQSVLDAFTKPTLGITPEPILRQAGILGAMQ